MSAPGVLGAELRRDLAQALLGYDGDAVDRIVATVGATGHGAFIDSSASLAGMLFERMAAVHGRDRSFLLALSDEQLADLLLSSAGRQVSLTRGERRSMRSSVGPIARGWRTVPGLWRGGSADTWLFSCMIPAGISTLQITDRFAPDELVDEWMKATDATD